MNDHLAKKLFDQEKQTLTDSSQCPDLAAWPEAAPGEKFGEFQYVGRLGASTLASLPEATNLSEVLAGNQECSFQQPTLAMPGPGAAQTQTITDCVTDGTRQILEELRYLSSNGDRYELLEEIARGGMGTVWKAWDQLIGRYVAIKIIHESHMGSDMMIRRFLAEGRITGLLEHPGTIPVHGIGVFPSGRPYIAMRLVAGEPLSQLLRTRRHTTEDLPRFLKVFERTCQTVAYAHAHRIIHRDLKPENVIVGSYGAIKVTDWGLAKRLDVTEGSVYSPCEFSGGTSVRVDPSLESESHRQIIGRSDTVCGTVFGTLAYLPPEQARGQTVLVDERADVFSLGAILCEILTGAPPYVSTSINELLRLASKANLSDAYSRLSHCSADSDLIELAMRCLSPDREERFRSAIDVSEQLTQCLEADQRRSERDLVRFFEISLDLFCIATFDGYFRRINANFHRILGYPEEFLLTQPFLKFVHPADQGATVEAMKQLEHGLPVVQFRNRYLDAVGNAHVLEWTAQSVPAEGAIYAVARHVIADAK